MNPAIIAALITFLGVIISVLVSRELARRAARDEIEKARRQLTSIYADKLLSARLAVYPPLYLLVSAFNKHIEGGSDKYMAHQALTTSDARDLLVELVVWDNKHALLLSDRAGRAIFRLRQQLIKVVRVTDPTADYMISVADVRSLLLATQQLELALKVDLGIYEVELYEGRASYQSYLKAAEDLESETAKPGHL